MQENHFRVEALFHPEIFHLCFNFFKKNVTRIGIRNVKRIGTKEQFDVFFNVVAAHYTINQSWMQVNNKFIVDQVVQRCFHARAFVLCNGCVGQVVFNLSLALEGIAAVVFLRNHGQFLTVEHRKTLFGDGCQGKTAGLHPQFLVGFVRRVATSSNYHFFVLSIELRYFNQFLNVFLYHFYHLIILITA